MSDICWLYTNTNGDRCVQFVQGLMPLDHWQEQALCLTSERDAAHAKGWNDAIEAGSVSVSEPGFH